MIRIPIPIPRGCLKPIGCAAFVLFTVMVFWWLGLGLLDFGSCILTGECSITYDFKWCGTWIVLLGVWFLVLLLVASSFGKET